MRILITGAIVGRGKVLEPYHFDHTLSWRDPHGSPWALTFASTVFRHEVNLHSFGQRVTRMKSPPVIVASPNDAGRSLMRIKSVPNDLKDERWLQELLYSHPKLLPVKQFDELYSPPIPIGREVPTKGAAGGLIDNGYVSPEGLITIVETKLWKHPEQHRTVVAQIIDYAKELATWNHEQLEQAVLESSKKRGEKDHASLQQKLAKALSENEKQYHEFLESVATCLTNARFLLLIVGDEISPNTTLLAKAIHGAPGLDFRLGLVEMHFYRQSPESEWPLIVVPEVVGRTVEKTRGVVRITYTNEKPQVGVTVDVDGNDGASTAKTLGLEEFMKSIPQGLVQPLTKWHPGLGGSWRDNHLHKRNDVLRNDHGR